MKVLWVIFSIWTGGDGNDLFLFDRPSFQTEIECVTYVKKNFIPLNRHVNNVHNAPGDTPNLFFCIRDDELKDKIEEIEKGPKV